MKNVWKIGAIMKRSREEIEQQFEPMKKLWEMGHSAREIAAACDTNICNVFNTFNLMGVSFKKPMVEKLVYADKRPLKLEKVEIAGKLYTDITPIFSPR